METNAKYVLVGLSVLMFLTLVILGVVWLRRSSSDAGLRFFEAYFQNQSLAGLREGSTVTMKGIPVGSVRRVEFDSRNTQRIRVLLALSENTPVKADSTAVVSRNIVTGLSTIDLSTGSSKGALLAGAKWASTDYPILREGAAELEAIRQSVPALLEQSADALAKIQAALSDNSRNRVEHILQNIDTITTQIASEDEGIIQLVKDMRALAKQMTVTVDTFKETADSVQRSVKLVSSQVSDSTNRITGAAMDAARRVAETAQKFQNPGRIITGPPAGELGPGEEPR